MTATLTLRGYSGGKLTYEGYTYKYPEGGGKPEYIELSLYVGASAFPGPLPRKIEVEVKIT